MYCVKSGIVKWSQFHKKDVHVAIRLHWSHLCCKTYMTINMPYNSNFFTTNHVLDITIHRVGV